MADSAVHRNRQDEAMPHDTVLEGTSGKQSPHHQQQQKGTSSDSLSLASPPADPPPGANSPPNYYMPNSALDMFLAYPLGQQEEKQRMKKGEGELEDAESGGKHEEENEQNLVALNRRQTRLYRTLVWAQFSMTVFTCIFILIIMILVAIILVMLQRTIDRADHAIRDNPVSQAYMKIKNAVNRINL